VHLPLPLHRASPEEFSNVCPAASVTHHMCPFLGHKEHGNTKCDEVIVIQLTRPTAMGKKVTVKQA